MSNEEKKKEDELIDKVKSFLKKEYESNSEFNLLFDDDEFIKVDSPKEKGVSYNISKSEALFWTDKVVYDDEFAFWDNERILSEHSSALKNLDNYEQRGIFKDLVDVINRNRIVPFIGAGMSCDSGFPRWGIALEKLSRKINNVDKSEVKNAIENYDYVKAAELLFQADETQVNNFIKTEFSNLSLTVKALPNSKKIL